MERTVIITRAQAWIDEVPIIVYNCTACGSGYRDDIICEEVVKKGNILASKHQISTGIELGIDIDLFSYKVSADFDKADINLEKLNSLSDEQKTALELILVYGEVVRESGTFILHTF